MRSVTARNVFCVLAMAGTALLCEPAFAQGYGGGGSGSAVGLVAGWSDALYNVLKFVMGGGAIISIGLASYHIIDGKNDAAKKFLSTIVICSISFALLAVLQQLSPGGGGGSLTANVAGILQLLLGMISMIAFVGIMIKLMSGEDQGVPMKLYTWLVASVLGFILLDLVAARGTI